MLCGEERLQSLLDGYCDNKPFAIFSDALPQGLVPMPTLPFTMWVPAESSAAERKRWKKMRWLARAALDYSPDRWHEFAQPHSETDGTRAAVAHNTIRRDTMTTGTDQFAPFQKEASFYEPNSVLDIHIVLEEERLSRDELLAIVRVLGQVGFGADASAGLGKFEVLSVDEDPTADTPCRRYVSLSACTPQGTGLRAETSFFRSQTYFGRHGAERVYGPSPFKRPILMAAPA